MKRALNHFPHDPDYDFGDANHLPIVPPIEETPPDASQVVTQPLPTPGAVVPGSDTCPTQ
jgi:hypothetical protein